MNEMHHKYSMRQAIAWGQKKKSSTASLPTKGGREHERKKMGPINDLFREYASPEEALAMRELRLKDELDLDSEATDVMAIEREKRRKAEIEE